MMYDRNLTMNMMEPVLQREEYFGKLEKVFRPFSGYIEDKICEEENDFKSSYCYNDFYVHLTSKFSMLLPRRNQAYVK